MTDIRNLIGAFAILTATLLAPHAASAQEKIKLGLLPFSESLAAVIADKQGFFKEEGLEVEITKFDSGAIAVPVLQSGRDGNRPQQHGLDVPGHRTGTGCHRAGARRDRADVAAGYDDRRDREEGRRSSRSRTSKASAWRSTSSTARLGCTCVAAARQARGRSHQGSLPGGAVPADERSAAERTDSTRSFRSSRSALR